jgi:hypothetical protein
MGLFSPATTTVIHVLTAQQCGCNSCSSKVAAAAAAARRNTLAVIAVHFKHPIGWQAV